MNQVEIDVDEGRPIQPGGDLVIVPHLVEQGSRRHHRMIRRSRLLIGTHGPYGGGVLVALALSVLLAPPFGKAEATAVDAGPPFTIEVSVEVSGTYEAVLARLISVGGELDPVALVPHEDGTWGATIELTERENLLVAFEAIPREGDSTISSEHRLTELGVDAAIFSIGTTTTTTGGGSGLSTDAWWLIAGAAAAVGALGLIGLWAAGGRSASTTGDAHEADLTEPTVDPALDTDSGAVDNRSGDADKSGDSDHQIP